MWEKPCMYKFERIAYAPNLRRISYPNVFHRRYNNPFSRSYLMIVASMKWEG